jgi:hypothetical protein
MGQEQLGRRQVAAFLDPAEQRLDQPGDSPFSQGLD